MLKFENCTCVDGLTESDQLCNECDFWVKTVMEEFTDQWFDEYLHEENKVVDFVNKNGILRTEGE